ncbi:BTAD domain-containing putative transcriptional regulator [Nonomuraea salmonea]|uniref:BTAD domain-containing putative transcriptional regulator n=1 Tax=Nonomuraea salmonea TaxID=46181 RepID=UPI0031EE2144
MEVLRHGVVLTPSAPKLRTVLSLLAVQSSIVVRTDKIIEELWEDNPPASVTTTLQTYIYQLRKLLRLGTPPDGRGAGDTPADAALRTSPYGYALFLDPDMLDTTRFERLSDQGRRELEAGDMNAAAETLSHALRLWRGPALVDVGHGPVLRAEVLRLEEINRNTLERRIEADLYLGRHHELLGELTRLAAEQPTHEGFQGKLMLALHRAGRRSEALQVYQRTRNTLASELGLDPSSDLEQLHRAVLAADESLALPQPRAPVMLSRTRPPRQLPPERTALVGRQPQVGAVLGGHCPRGSITRHRWSSSPVHQDPASPRCARRSGTGPTAPTPTASSTRGWWTPRAAPPTPRDVLAEFLRALDVPEDRIPGTLSERSRLFRTWTADRHVLVTLDDVVRADQLLPLVPASPDCGVLVTARRQLSAPVVTAVVEVGPLNVEEGLRLLTNVLGKHRVMEDEAAARELVRLCDGLPTALQAAAALLQLRRHWPLSKVVKGSGLPSEPGTPNHHELFLYASVELSYRLAPLSVQRAFRKLTRLDISTFTPRFASCLLDMTEAQTESLLDELVEFQLMVAELGTDGDLHYRFLPSVRAAGRLLLADAGPVDGSAAYRAVGAGHAHVS